MEVGLSVFLVRQTCWLSSLDNVKEETLSINPFNPTTLIQYSIAKDSYVSLKVYNLLGQEVMTLVDEIQPNGYITARFDASQLSSGVYFYRLQAGSYTNVKKMLLMK